MKRFTATLFLSIAILAILCGCSRLSSQAKKIVGVYYNTELSDTQPVMELKKDGRCVITAIKPGVLTYSVEGRWNVENDSLLLELNPATIVSEGDDTLIGNIPERMSQHIHSYSDLSLQLEREGVVYSYKRQN